MKLMLSCDNRLMSRGKRKFNPLYKKWSRSSPPSWRRPGRDSDGQTIYKNDNPLDYAPNTVTFWTKEPCETLEEAEGRKLLHRLGGPALVGHELLNYLPLEAWYEDGELHRTDGAAVTYSEEAEIHFPPEEVERLIGDEDVTDPISFRNTMVGPARLWYREGMIHREVKDGPAVECRFGADDPETGEILLRVARIWCENGRDPKLELLE